MVQCWIYPHATADAALGPNDVLLLLSLLMTAGVKVFVVLHAGSMHASRLEEEAERWKSKMKRNGCGGASYSFDSEVSDYGIEVAHQFVAHIVIVVDIVFQNVTVR